MDEKELFTKAVSIESPEERAAFLVEACGDNSELRSSVEQLLQLHVESGGFLESPAIEGPVTESLDPATADNEDRWQTTLADRTVILDDISLNFLQPSNQPDSLGRLGPYEISKVIGRGGMGIVLKGYDSKLRRVVAVKVLAPERASNPTARKRFLREAQAAAAVSHDHVVTIHAVEESDLPYLVMELVDGPSLQEKIDRNGHLELKEILRIGR